MNYREANWFWRIFIILNGVAILVFATTIVWAAFDIHDRIGFVMIAQIPPLLLLAIRKMLK